MAYDRAASDSSGRDSRSRQDREMASGKSDYDTTKQRNERTPRPKTISGNKRVG